MSEPTRAAGMDPMAAARHEWMDYAKGICILAVVTMYTTTHVQTGMDRTSWMQWWLDFAHPFRMPDFFFISGLLLARVIDRPWAAYADKKVVHHLYFFAVWTLIYFVLRVAIGHVERDPPALWREFVKVSTHGPFAMLWFIQMLPVYFVLTRLLRRVPWPWVLAGAVLWYLAPIDTPWMQVDRAGDRFVFFYAGYIFAGQAFALARWAALHATAACCGLAAWALANGTLVFTGATQHGSVGLLLGLAGAIAVVTVAALLQAAGQAGWLRHCGEHSLPIYLGFYIPMSVLTSLCLALQQHGGVALEPGVLAVLLAAASIFTALAACRLARHTPLAWLYERPAWAALRGAAQPAAAPGASSSLLADSPANSRR
jgi:uncharacterized membrane protein YcfT